MNESCEHVPVRLHERVELVEPELGRRARVHAEVVDVARAQVEHAARGEQRLVRQLILGHICSGTSSLAEVRAKNCAVAVAGQTHACYLEEGHLHVGTSRLGRTDIAFDGGVIHEVCSCLMVLSLGKHTQRLQPSLTLTTQRLQPSRP